MLYTLGEEPAQEGRRLSFEKPMSFSRGDGLFLSASRRRFIPIVICNKEYLSPITFKKLSAFTGIWEKSSSFVG